MDKDLAAFDAYEKCRSILRVLEMCGMDENDRDNLIVSALDYLEELALITGIVTSE